MSSTRYPHAVRRGAISFVWRPRSLVIASVAGILALVVAVVSLGIGDVALSPAEVVNVLGGGGTRSDQVIVNGLRLPRAVLAIVVGASLGVAGAIVQTTARNALASPDLLGVSAGASAGAVAVIVLGGAGGQASGLLRGVGVPVAAVVGGLVAASVVGLILRIVEPTGAQPLLVGVGVSAFFGGLVSWLMIAASIDDAARANVWLTGSLNGRAWPEVASAGAVTVLVFVALVPLSWRLSTLALGASSARSLGLRPTPTIVLLLVLSVLLVASATAVSGPIGFVALVAPHLARMAAGASRSPLLASAAIGALLVITSDLVARTVLAPIILPVGAVTAAVGAPFLLWLLVRRRKASS